MLDKDHIITSEACYLGITELVNLHQIPSFNIITTKVPYICLISLGIWLGSQLPDLDTTSSNIGRYTRPISSIIAHFGHHGITHSIFGLLLVAYLLLYAMPHYLTIRNIYAIYFLYGTTLGYALHLVEDAFSKAGIIWFFPFYPAYRKWKYNIYVRSKIHTKWRYKTGGSVEKFIRDIDILIIVLSVTSYCLI